MDEGDPKLEHYAFTKEKKPKFPYPKINDLRAGAFQHSTETISEKEKEKEKELQQKIHFYQYLLLSFICILSFLIVFFEQNRFEKDKLILEYIEYLSVLLNKTEILFNKIKAFGKKIDSKELQRILQQIQSLEEFSQESAFILPPLPFFNIRNY